MWLVQRRTLLLRPSSIRSAQNSLTVYAAEFFYRIMGAHEIKFIKDGEPREFLGIPQIKFLQSTGCVLPKRRIGGKIKSSCLAMGKSDEQIIPRRATWKGCADGAEIAGIINHLPEAACYDNAS